MDADKRRLVGLVAGLAGSGIMHFVMPEQYEKIVPPQIPGSARFHVLASGAAEIAFAALLAVPKTRRQGALLSAGLFVAVFPANLYSIKVVGPSKVKQAGAIVRLPMQIPMITSALKVARES